MIGKKLSQRGPLRPLETSLAEARLEAALEVHGRPIVEVRAQGREHVACVVLRADEGAVRACKKLGIELKPGGDLVFGLRGADAARLFGNLPAAGREWLERPAGERETKVLLLAGGVALLSLEVADGKVTVRAPRHSWGT